MKMLCLDFSIFAAEKVNLCIWISKAFLGKQGDNQLEKYCTDRLNAVASTGNSKTCCLWKAKVALK